MFIDETQVDSLETESVEEVEVLEEETTEEATEETTEETEALDWKAEAKKWRAIALRKKPKVEKVENKPAQDGLSAADLLAVAKSGIEAEDLDEVLEYAKFKGVSVHEALKSSVIKATLAEKTELRRSAEAANTGAARRGTASQTDEALLANARKGVMPESEADIARLAKLQMLARRG